MIIHGTGHRELYFNYFAKLKLIHLFFNLKYRANAGWAEHLPRNRDHCETLRNIDTQHKTLIKRNSCDHSCYQMQ